MESREELFRHINEWDAFVRRHKANIFDVFFKDVTYSMKDDERLEIVTDAAGFFNLDVPSIQTHVDTAARMILEPEESSESELQYNWKLLMDTGINNHDAFTLSMIHELAHLYFKGRRFMLCKSERWCHELAADYIVGIYSSMKNLATGKYKYVVGRMPASLTHPNGGHRAGAVEYARTIREKIPCGDIESAMTAFPAYIYNLSKILNRELDEIINLLMEAQNQV